MLWERDRNKKHLVIAPIETRSNSLSHGFNDHPYLTNSKTNNDLFIPSSAPSYAPELWHYGVKGMHWGEITKDRDKIGYTSRTQISRSNDQTSMAKQTASKVAKLQNIKKKMQQKRVNLANSKIVRIGNKVIRFHKRPRKTKEEIAESGAKKIDRMIEKTNNRIDKGIDFSGMFDKFMKKKLG